MVTCGCSDAKNERTTDIIVQLAEEYNNLSEEELSDDEYLFGTCLYDTFNLYCRK